MKRRFFCLCLFLLCISGVIIYVRSRPILAQSQKDSQQKPSGQAENADSLNNAEQPDITAPSGDAEQSEEKMQSEAAQNDEKTEDQQSMEKVQPGGLYAYAACLLDAKNNRVLFEKNGGERLPMASTTKIMTLIVLLEQASMDDIVTVSKNAASQPDVQLNINTGEQYRLGDLVYSLMLESHNDTAVALAEHVGGTVEGFCALMNAKAASLGLTDTSFETPNGLDADQHYTTAVELSKIASYAMKLPEFIKITTTTTYQFNEITTGRSCVVNNKNRFLYMMEGAVGMKTGFTGKAGYCFAGALKRQDYELVSVVLACGWPPNKSYKWSDTKKLMDYGLTNYKKSSPYERSFVVINGMETSAELSEAKDEESSRLALSKLLPEKIPVINGEKESVRTAVTGRLPEDMLLAGWDQLKIEIDYTETLEAPVLMKQSIGMISFFINGELYGSAEVTAAEEVKRLSFGFCLKKIFDCWLNL